jgi:pilus assembly protein TadC
MEMTVSRRPFGVSLLSILVIVAGALDVIAGILSISVRGDNDLLVELKGSQGEITAFGTGLISLGVIAIVVGFMLWRGSGFARILIGIIALVRLIGTIWAFASFDREHWYEGIGSVVIYALVAGYLLFGATARDYTAST